MAGWMQRQAEEQEDRQARLDSGEDVIVSAEELEGLQKRAELAERARDNEIERLKRFGARVVELEGEVSSLRDSLSAAQARIAELSRADSSVDTERLQQVLADIETYGIGTEKEDKPYLASLACDYLPDVIAAAIGSHSAFVRQRERAERWKEKASAAQREREEATELLSQWRKAQVCNKCGEESDETYLVLNQSFIGMYQTHSASQVECRRKLAEENRQLTSRINALQSDYDQLNANLESTVNGQRETIESLNAGNLRLREKLEKANKTINALSIENNTLKQIRDVQERDLLKAESDLSAARKEAFEEKWQPISTAPKGVKILGAYQNAAYNWRRVMMRYYGEGELETLDSTSDEDYAPAGWYEECESQEDILLTEEEPQLWMPLPQPPIASKEGQN